MTAPLVVTPANRTLVRTSRSWPSDSSGWTTLEGAWAESRSGSFCNDVGAASVVYPFGSVQRQGSPVVLDYSAPSLCGSYVMICEEDPAGTVVASDGETFTPVWVGVIYESAVEPDSDSHGYTCNMQCVGALSLLDQVVPAVHFCTPQSGSLAADIGAAAEFNNVGGKKTGNRSAIKYDFGGGYSAYVFDFTSAGVLWSNLDVAEYAIALAHIAAPGGPAFVLEGQTDSLYFQEKVSLGGSSCLEMLSRMINPKQGHGFRTIYDPATNRMLIDVMSLSQTEIPTHGDQSIPANDRQKTLDLTPAQGLSEWSIKEGQAATFDEINVVMAPDQYCATLTLLDVEPDWTEQELSDWEAADKDDPERASGALEKVGRRFKLKADMTGTLLGGFVLPTSRVTESSTLHGAGGYTGILADDGARSSIGGMRLLKKLPVPTGYDWESQDPVDADARKEDMKPMAFVLASGDSEYSTLADYCGLNDVQIEIDEDASAITFGPASVADFILDMLDSGDTLLITVGIESQMNTIVSWYRDPVAKDKARVLTKSREKFKRQFIVPGCVLGIDDAGALKTCATLKTVHDDLPLALDTLAILQPWFANPEWAVSFTLRGVVDVDYSEGDLITEATYQAHDGTTVTVPAVGVITSIRRSYSDPGSVSLTTKRLMVDLEAVS